MHILEANLEQSCRRYAEQQGGKLLKIKDARGWPDRLVMKPGGKAAFVELKRLNKKPRELQAHRLCQLLEAGFEATYVDTIEDFKNVYDRL